MGPVWQTVSFAAFLSESTGEHMVGIPGESADPLSTFPKDISP